jgi:hypothetical protein
MIWRWVVDPRIQLFVAVAFPFLVLGIHMGIFIFLLVE